VRAVDLGFAVTAALALVGVATAAIGGGRE